MISRFVVAGCMMLGITACASVEQSFGFLHAAVTPAVEPAASDLSDFLVDNLGVTARQAMGGAGSIFALAQQRMLPEDFMQLRNSVPNMDQYLAAVPYSTSSFQWGGATNGIGGNPSELGSLSAVSRSFQTLDMNPEMAFQFLPAILQYLQQRSELAAMSLLQDALHYY